jgi:1-acyl-sn-glycerol-3-phosphate acyltransferase
LSRDGAPRPGPSLFVYHFVRLGLKAVVSLYARVRVEGADRLPPEGSYIICFNHPSWLDPIVLAACWPDPARRLFIFGPREADMRRGVRNRLITWTGRGVPFKPGGADVRDATRRALSVLRSDACLAVAGEGRLSDREGEPLPLETGVAHFAQLARVPVVPTAIVGTRWVHFGCRVRIRVGEPVDAADFERGRDGVARMTRAIEGRLRALLEGVRESEPPGPVGRFISEAFNDRPWLELQATDGDGADGPPDGSS